MTQDEKQIITRFLRGEPGGFEALYALYGKRIYRFCHRLCRNSSDAEDLTQEVFLAAFQGLERFQGRSSLTTWLYRVALFRWRRTSGAPSPRTVPFDETRILTIMSPDPASDGLRRMSLEKALAALSEPLREAFLLVKAEELTCREAAEVLGIPEGTLKFRVHQAVQRLQSELKTEEVETNAVTSLGAACRRGGER